MRLTYKDYVKLLLQADDGSHNPTLVARLLGCGLCASEPITNDEYDRVLIRAEQAFGGNLAVGVRMYAQRFTAVGVWRDAQDRVVIHETPLVLLNDTLSAKDKDLTLRPGTPALFRMTAWLARAVFGQHDHDQKAFPLLHETVHAKLMDRLEVGYKAPLTMRTVLREFDAYVRSVALHSTDFDYMDSGIVDVLHASGVVCVGSVNEVTCASERASLLASLAFGKEHGFTHLWWLEDYTPFEEGGYVMVVRFSVCGKPYYMKRRLQLSKDRLRLVDQMNTSTSPEMSWAYGTPSTLDFCAWVASFLPPGSKPMPYLRTEIVHRYKTVNLPPHFQYMTRPCLVRGTTGVLTDAHNSDLAHRLYYSPDLFIESRKVPIDANPSTVHLRIVVRPFLEDADFQVYLSVEGDDKHAFRILCHRDGQQLPNADELCIHVESQDTEVLGPDAVQVVVLKRTLSPLGGISVEVILTTYWKSFRLYGDSPLCDYEVGFMVFEHKATVPPKVYPRVPVPVFGRKVQSFRDRMGLSHTEAVQRALRVFAECPVGRIPVVMGSASPSERRYTFRAFDGASVEVASP